jgi:DNA-binding HxlR family transcriptional regulator
MIQTPDCLQTQCPIQFTVDIIGNKWSILILRELFSGRRRTCVLMSALPGISSKTLAQRLRELEQHGLVERQIFAEVPPRVEYSLTEKGRELQPLMDALYAVGRSWLKGDECNCALISGSPS